VTLLAEAATWEVRRLRCMPARLASAMPLLTGAGRVEHARQKMPDIVVEDYCEPIFSGDKAAEIRRLPAQRQWGALGRMRPSPHPPGARW
jgi:hypothetical protein